MNTNLMNFQASNAVVFARGKTLKVGYKQTTFCHHHNSDNSFSFHQKTFSQKV